MTPATHTPPDLDVDLHAYVDGQAGPDLAAEIEARLAADPDLRRTVDAVIADRDGIRAAAAALDTAAAAGPVNLQSAALERKLGRRLVRRHWEARLTGPAARQIAAGLALFAMGWGAHMAVGPAERGYPLYVAEGLGAHSVFADDKVRPVEFTPDGTTDALAWMSEKLKRKIDNPALDALGLTLVGTRLSGTREGPLAQFIYEDKSGNRLSLVVMPHPEGTPEAGFRVARHGLNNVGYWSDAALDYAVIAQTSGMQIETVAAEVSRNVHTAR